MAKTLGSQQVPSATRRGGPGWRDPRLWVGVVLVAASVVVGARLFAAADDTVAVWATAERHGAGDRLEADDLTAVRVRFEDAGTLAGYYAVDADLPDLQLTRGVEPGELLPRGSVGAAADTGLVQVPIAVEPEQVPGSVTAGALVDIYLVAPVAQEGAGAPAAAAPVDAGAPALSEVTVLEAPSPSESFGTSGRRQLVLAVPQESAATFFQRLGATQSPVITVVRRG